jgi:Calcineurin-like phosphoesterase
MASETDPRSLLVRTDRNDLDVFIEDFLVPIVADGRIDSDEETPLNIAFQLYRIAELGPKPEEHPRIARALDQIVGELVAYRAPQLMGGPLAGLADVREILRRDLDDAGNRVAEMTTAEFKHILGWFDGLAHRLGVDLYPEKTEHKDRLELDWIFDSLAGRGSDPVADADLMLTAYRKFCGHISHFAKSELTRFEGCLHELARKPRISSHGFGNPTVEAAYVRFVAEVKRLLASRVAPVGAAVIQAPYSGSERGREDTAPAAVKRAPEPAGPPLTVIEGELQTWDQLQLRWVREADANDETATQLLRRMQQTPFALAFDDLRGGPGGPRVIFVDEPTLVPAQTWFVGDLHGDLLAFEAVLEYTRFLVEPDVCLVLLGDVIDDGNETVPLLDRLFGLLLTESRRLCWLAGNHDDALRQLENGDFASEVSPASFVESLNADAAGRFRRLGEAVIALMKQAPRALIFPDGLLAAHGGFPHSDLWNDRVLMSRDGLSDPRCLQDFVWLRTNDRAKTKKPNRYAKGCEFGYLDFAGFCERSKAFFERSVSRLIRGHDHLDDRYGLYPVLKEGSASHSILTINTLCQRLGREAFGPLARRPCIARYVPGALPEVHRIHVPEDIIERRYQENAARGDR